MIIQELIAAKVAQMTSNGDSFTFLHSEKDWQNLQSDEQLFPAVFLDMPVKVTPTILNGGGYQERYVCVLTFLYKSNLDDNPDQQYTTLKLCNSAMRNFILLVEDDPDNFEVDKNVFGEAFQMLNMFDRNMDGIVLQFTCVPRDRPDVCIPSFGLPIGDCDPATVKSTGVGFSQLIESGGTLILPNINFSITNSDDTVLASGTQEAQSDVIEELPDVTHTDSDGSSVLYPSGKAFACSPSNAGKYAKLKQTGQTTSYITGDDITRGRAVSYFVLNYVNEFGHSFRLCGQTGGYTDGVGYFDVNGAATSKALAFPNDIIIDFSSRTESDILTYYMGDASTYRGYDVAVPVHLASTFGGLTGWNLANDIEYRNIMSVDSMDNFTHWLGHKPFEFDGSNRYFISSVQATTTALAFDMQSVGFAIPTSLTNALLNIFVRYSSKTELGI